MSTKPTPEHVSKAWFAKVEPIETRANGSMPAQCQALRAELLAEMVAADELRAPPVKSGHAMLWLVHQGATLRADYTTDEVEIDDERTALNVTIEHLWAGAQDVCELVGEATRQAIADEIEQHLEASARDDAEQARISAHLDARDWAESGFGF